MSRGNRVTAVVTLHAYREISNNDPERAAAEFKEAMRSEYGSSIGLSTITVSFTNEQGETVVLRYPGQ